MNTASGGKKMYKEVPNKPNAIFASINPCGIKKKKKLLILVNENHKINSFTESNFKDQPKLSY